MKDWSKSPWQNRRDNRTLAALAIMAVACFLACNAATAQPNWRTLLIQRDTMAIGPLKAVRQWAGLRMAKNIAQRQCAWELVERAKELESARQTIEAKNATIFKKDEAIGKLREANEATIDRARRAERKVKRRKPWMWFGLGAATLYVVQQQMK